MAEPLFSSFLVADAFHRPALGETPEHELAELSRIEAVFLKESPHPQQGSIRGVPSSKVTLGHALADIASGRSVILNLNADLPDAGRAAVMTFLETLLSISGTVEKNRQEDAIAKLASVMLPDEAAVARGPIAADNLAQRDRFLAEIPTISGLNISAQAGHKSGNPYATAARWKKNRDIFAVAHRGSEHFPVFQFQDGRPRPAIKQILCVLPEWFSPWQRAFWFVSTNGWLDGDAPMARLDDIQAVVAAAKHEAEELIG